MEERNIVNNLENESDVATEYTGEVKEEDKTTTSKKAKKNKKRIMSLKAMFDEIESYGYHYSFKQFLTQLLMVWGIMGVAAYFYKLKLIPIILLIILGAILTPVMILAQQRYKYENQKFDDAGDYLQQMATSFLKSRKIRDSLAETAIILQGRRIHDALIDAIDYLDNRQSATLFEDAFAIIEEEYGCEKMKALHAFLIKVEKEGGEFEDTLNLMINDNQSWIQRTYIYQGRRKSTHMAILMGIILAIIMCGVLNAYIPDNLEFVTNSNGDVGHISLAIYDFTIYQVVSTIYLGIMVGIYTLTQTVMQGSWLKDKGIRKDKEIVKDWVYYRDFDIKFERKKYAVWFVVFMFVAVIAYFVLKQPTFALIFAFCAVYYITMPKRKLRSTKKRLERDLQKAFPDWVRDVSISLNSQTVHNAIMASEEKTPTVMKPAVRRLIEEFSEDPVSYVPWANFLAEFDVPEIKSASRMFYSINELSGKSAKEQINILINRNTRAVQEADEKKADDEITMLGYMVALPLAVSIFKLIVDLFLLLFRFTNITSIIGSVFGAMGY